MEIKVIVLPNLPNAGHCQFHEEIVGFINRDDVVRLKIQALVTPYRFAFTNLSDLFKITVKSPVTEKIEFKDGERDLRFIALRDAVKLGLKHFSEEVREAARIIMILFNSYGRIDKKPYNYQTALVSSLVADLKSDTYKNCIALLRAKDQLDELERLNNEFVALMNERMDEYAARNPAKVLTLRKTVDEIYLNIRKAVNGLVAIEGEASYADFIRRVNLTVDKYKRTMATTGSKKKKVVINAEVSDETNG